MIDRAQTASRIAGGVDTRKDTHTAAALDANGRAIGNATFVASAAGYAQLLEWLRSFGVLDYATTRDAERFIGDNTENFCNVERLHSHLDYVSPIEFELKDQLAAIAA